MRTSNMNDVVANMHAAFATAAELPLNNFGTVNGLTVVTDTRVDGVQVDLFGGFKAVVNPTWAAAKSQDELAQTLTGVFMAELA